MSHYRPVLAKSEGTHTGARVLVTGASGFIGSHLCRRLLEEGAAVHAVSRLRRESTFPGLYWHHGNLVELGEVRAILEATRPDFIFHLASHVAGARDLSKVLPTFYDNLSTTVHLLTVAAEMGGCPRIVLASSSEEPDAADMGVIPCSPYAAAKWASSAYARMFHKLFGTQVVMARIFMTYGPDQKDLNKLVPYVTLSLLRGERPALSSGTRLADWIYIDDVVEGLLRAAFMPGIEGRAFDLGTGRLSSVRQVAEHIAEITGSRLQPHFGALVDRPLEQERSADTNFMRDVLGCEPRTSLRDGLEQTVAWYRQQLNAALAAH